MNLKPIIAWQCVAWAYCPAQGRAVGREQGAMQGNQKERLASSPSEPSPSTSLLFHVEDATLPSLGTSPCTTLTHTGQGLSLWKSELSLDECGGRGESGVPLVPYPFSIITLLSFLDPTQHHATFLPLQCSVIFVC